MSTQYLSVEWLWDTGSLRVTRPDQPEKSQPGSYQEVVNLLTALGAEGWDVCACVSNANWIYWTMKKQ